MGEPITKTEFAKRCGVSACAVTKLTRGRLRDAMIGQRIDFAHPDAQDYFLSKTTTRPVTTTLQTDPLLGGALEHCRDTGRWTASAIARRLSIGYARALRILEQLTSLGHVPGSQIQVGAGVTEQAPPPPKPPPEPAKPRKHGPGRKSTWEDNAQLIEIPDDIDALADLTLRELIERYGTAYRFLDWLKALKEVEAVSEKRIKNAQSAGKLVSRKLVETGIIDPFNAAHIRLMSDGAKTITETVLSKHLSGAGEQEIEACVSDVVGSFIRPVKSKIERNLKSVDNED